MFTKTVRLIRDGEKGGRRWGKGEIIYLSQHCHHQNDSCIKTGSDGSHFYVLLIVLDKVTRPVSTKHTLFEEKGEPRLTSLTARSNPFADRRLCVYYC